MRVIKSEADIALMREAGRISEAAFAETLGSLRLGMTELEIVEEVNYQLRKHGSLGQSFTTSLYNSGPNHPLLFGQRMESWRAQPGAAGIDPLRFWRHLSGLVLRFWAHGLFRGAECGGAARP